MKLASVIFGTAQRGRDVAMWPVNLLRDLPVRLDRLGETVLQGAARARRTVPEGLSLWQAGDRARRSAWLRQKAAGSATWQLGLSARLFDLSGGPELGQLLIHLGCHVEPLTPAESAAARAVLGPNAMRWATVRLAHGGLLERIFRRNGARSTCRLRATMPEQTWKSSCTSSRTCSSTSAPGPFT
jgi:hypothetical protein